MNRYLLDARHISASSADGATRVSLGLIRACANMAANDEEVVILALPEAATFIEQQVTAQVVSVDLRPASLASFSQTADVVQRFSPDVYLYPQFDLPLIMGSVRTLSFIYDVTPLTFRGYFGAGSWWKSLAAGAMVASTCARSSKILTTSQATRDQLVELLPSVESRVQVVYPGPSISTSMEPGLQRHNNRFIYVGNHRPHKQIPLLLQAFSSLRHRLPSAELLLVGRPDPRFPEVPRLLKGPLGRGVQLLEGLDDAAVLQKIATSRALVFPSVGEGFGMPVLESYSVGTPAIVANTGSLPEIAGDAATCVPPFEPAAFAEAMFQMANNQALWDERRAKTGTLFNQFSWDRAGKEVLQSIRNLV